MRSHNFSVGFYIMLNPPTASTLLTYRLSLDWSRLPGSYFPGLVSTLLDGSWKTGPLDRSLSSLHCKSVSGASVVIYYIGQGAHRQTGGGDLLGPCHCSQASCCLREETIGAYCIAQA